MSRRRLRCAIYTRKSTEEGLDQAFNSLDAQREACAAYIKSQASEGWTCLKARYDDGGVSGGTMERPALQRLLADIGSGKIEIVLVYKVDRLTRALSDFAKMVEVFDAKGVSFVSVTQQFNTTTSMGRLTLNVLLSFAQFEREVTAERIRDKIAASKKKGMWMGGSVPLGYDVVDRKLVPNEAEAETVRTLFQLYLRLSNVRLVKEEVNRLGLRTKIRQSRDGRHPGGQPFMRGHIYRLLNNPTYIGKVAYNGELYQGVHAAIVDREMWDATQVQLQANAVARHSRANRKGQYLLTDLLVDQNGNRMIPNYANKAGRRYHYYVSKRSTDMRLEPGAGRRLPAKAIEEAVLNGICAFLGDKLRLIMALNLEGTPPGRLKAILSNSCDLNDRLQEAGPVVRREVFLEVLDHVEVGHDHIRITLHRYALRSMMDEEEPAMEREPVCTGSECDLTLDLPITVRRRGVETKLIIADERDPKPVPDPGLIRAVAQAHVWFSEMRKGEACSVRDLSRRHNIDPGNVSRTLPLAFLAPDIIEAILEGRQPLDLTATRLKRMPDLPDSWAEQRRRLGVEG